MPYAQARRLNGVTGDWAYDATTTYAASPSPALEIVMLTLRTVKGSCRANPSWGADWDRVDKLRATAAADATAVIREALAFAVRNGTIRDLVVAAEADPDTGRLLYEVDFYDVRAATRRTTGRQPVP